MRNFKLVIVCLLLAIPVVALGFDSDDLPSTSTWYFHADFEEMRSSEGGMGLWVWLDDEVFDDVREDAGIDLSEEADHITAYSTPESGVVFVLEGNLKQETKDKALVAAASAERFDTLKHKEKTYYYVQGDDDGFDGGNVSIDGVDNRGYFSFAVKNKLIAASNEEQMKVLLDNGGKIKGSKSHDGALFVLTAEKSLIQAGMDTDGFSDDDDDEEGGFKSNIMRNTKQAALMIADVAGMIAIEAQLITEEPEMADSMASIVRGLIALGMFSDDMEPEVAEFLRSTKVDVDDKVLKVSVTLSPEVLTSALDEA
jgi:hypothetical protein